MPICSLPKWSHNVFALQIYKFLSIWARVSCNFIFDIGNKMECLNRCKPMIYREIEIKNEGLVSSSFWAVDEAWTRDLFLTKEVLYHWATTAISLFEWCKNSIKKTFLKFLSHFFVRKNPKSAPVRHPERGKFGMQGGCRRQNRCGKLAPQGVLRR